MPPEAVGESLWIDGVGISTDSTDDWCALVAQVKAGEDAGVEQLYKRFSRGLQHFIVQQLGPEEVEQRVFGTLLLVVEGIQRGDLHEPERLGAFVSTILRRQVAAYIERASNDHREDANPEAGVAVSDRKQSAKLGDMLAHEAKRIKSVLAALPDRDREILLRFYVQAQPEEQICREMGLSSTQFGFIRSRAKAKIDETGTAKKLGQRSGVFSTLVTEPVPAEEADTTESEQDANALIQSPVVSLLMEVAAAFQDLETGTAWLSTPAASLGNVAPITLFSTASGREIIANELGLIQHGMF